MPLGSHYYDIASTGGSDAAEDMDLPERPVLIRQANLVFAPQSKDVKQEWKIYYLLQGYLVYDKKNYSLWQGSGCGVQGLCRFLCKKAGP